MVAPGKHHEWSLANRVLDGWNYVVREGGTWDFECRGSRSPGQGKGCGFRVQLPPERVRHLFDEGRRKRGEVTIA